MTKQEVLELIAKHIIKNDNGEITATVLQPILEQMVLQPNILIGRLELLNTTEKDSLVDAINSIASMNIDELVDTVQLLVENDIAQDESISELKNETERLETEKISDAPADGKQYARQDEEWSEVVLGLERVDLADGTVSYKLDSNSIIPEYSNIDLRAGNQETAIGTYAVCISADGAGNIASGNISTVSGGQGNSASGASSTVSGGYSNTASGASSTLSGGQSNTASGASSTVSGGHSNTASGDYSTVSGGQRNTATNYSETVVGMFSDNTGEIQTTRVEGSPIFRVGIGIGTNDRKDGFQVKNDGKVYAPHQTIDLTTDPTQLVTKEYADSIGGISEAPEDGKTYGRKDAIWQEVVVDVSNLATKVELSDGLDLKADLTYVNEELDKKADISDIPDVSNLATKIELTDGLDLKANKSDVDADLLQLNTEIGQVEQSLTTKIGDAPSDGKQYARQDEDWSEVISGGGGSGSLVKVDLADGTVAYKLDSNDFVPTTPSIDLRAGNQTEQLGAYAVCVSTMSGGESNTASGVASTISGGAANTARGEASTVSGGISNTASGELSSTVSGGIQNTASGTASTVSGGEQNTASGRASTVSGGEQNTASGEVSTVSGGINNTSSGIYSTVSGGYSNTAEGDASTVSGGIQNTASGRASAVSGGQSNTATNYSETVVGMFSDNTGTPETSRVAGSPIFRVGIGTANNNRRDGLIVTNEGNLKLPEAGVWIELTSPNGTAYKLTVSDAGELVITAV